MGKLLSYLRIARPANLVTSVSDVLAGMALSGVFLDSTLQTILGSVFLLCISSIGLYGGGIVFNDVFDFKLDQVERPERTIPSGQLSLKEATIWGVFLFAIGLFAAFTVNSYAGLLALLIIISALVYNKWGKHHSLLGPPNMGLCRGLNLLLGVSIISERLLDLWFLAFIPILYISAITMISRGEVHGSERKPLYTAAFLYSLVIGLILYFAFIENHLVVAFSFLLAFSVMIFAPLYRAIKIPSGAAIRKSVKAGVMALILMNAAWASAVGVWQLAILIAALLPLSYWLAHKFSVT